MVQASGSANRAFSTSAFSRWPPRYGAERAEDGRAGESQIADRVERLVAHELVGEAKPLAVDDAVVADGDSVLKRSAKGKTRRPEPLHVLHEAEGAGAGKLAAERARIDVDLDPLRPISGESKSISTSIWKPLLGVSSPKAPASSTAIRFSTLRKRRGVSSSAKPASSIASTNRRQRCRP